MYEISKSYNISSYLTLESCLFGAVSLNKIVDIDKYKTSDCGIGFDRIAFFSHPSSGTGKNVIIFKVDMSSSTKIDNRKKDNFILGKGPTQEWEHHCLQKKCIQLILLKIIKKSVCACIAMKQTVTYLLIVKKFISLKWF